MRLGISSYTYGWAVAGGDGAPGLSALELIDRAVETGVGVLQLCDNLPSETYDVVSVEAIATHAARGRIAMEIGTRGIAIAHLRRFIQTAARLKSPILRVVTDTAGEHPSAADIVRNVGAVIGDLDANKVTLAIENHDRFRAAELAGIVRELRTPRIGICLDTVNSFGALEGPHVVVETLGPHVVNLHIKDFAVKRFGHLQGFTIEGRPAGDGMLDIPWLLGRLRDFGRDPNAIIELWTPPEATISETSEKEALWAQQSVRALRQYIQN